MFLTRLPIAISLLAFVNSGASAERARGEVTGSFSLRRLCRVFKTRRHLDRAQGKGQHAVQHCHRVRVLPRCVAEGLPAWMAALPEILIHGSVALPDNHSCW